MNKKNMRRPVIETGASEWKSEMLPLHHERNILATGIEPATFGKLLYFITSTDQCSAN